MAKFTVDIYYRLDEGPWKQEFVPLHISARDPRDAATKIARMMECEDPDMWDPWTYDTIQDLDSDEIVAWRFKVR